MLSRLNEWERIWSANIYGFTYRCSYSALHVPSKGAAKEKNKAGGHVGRDVSSVFLVISQPLYLQAKLNPNTPGMVRPLLAQILKPKPLLTISCRREKVKVAHHPQMCLNKCNGDQLQMGKLEESNQALLKGLDESGLYSLHKDCSFLKFLMLLDAKS